MRAITNTITDTSTRSKVKHPQQYLSVVDILQRHFFDIVFLELLYDFLEFVFGLVRYTRAKIRVRQKEPMKVLFCASKVIK